MIAAAVSVGLCGKLPARADFVTRRLPPSAVEAWHAWLAEALVAMRAALGEGWLDAYLHGPIWRFALPAGVIGPKATAGTLMPSVDSVGRYFPFSIMCPLPSLEAVIGVAAMAENWFAVSEAASLEALEEGRDLDDIDALVAALPAPEWNASWAPGAADVIVRPGTVLPLGSEPSQAAAMLATIAPNCLARGNSLWWTLGSETIEPVALIAATLPAPSAFAALFSGRWEEYGWRPRGGGDEPADE